MIDLLDDEKAPVLLHDALDIRKDVARRHQEVSRVGADGLVLVLGQCDQTAARGARALAEELDEGRRLPA